MLSFATEFPVTHSHSPVDLLYAVRDWIIGSPHTRLVEADFSGIEIGATWGTTKHNEQIEVIHTASGTAELAAFRYARLDNGLEWVTTIVFSRMQADSWIAVRVTCESRHPAARLPPARKPVVLRTLLDKLGGAQDGLLGVQVTPHLLGNDEIDVATRLILGQSGCRLPIVYISSGFHNQYVLNPNDLAVNLAGMAHVVVEPNRSFSLRLKIEVASENVYGGTIGIYWPDGGGRRSFFIGPDFESAEDLSHAVFEEVRAALVNRRAIDRCTWATAQETVSRRAFEALRAAGSQEVDKYIEEFDKEFAAKDQRLKDAEREIARLQMELRIYESRLPISSGLSLRTGTEQDLYPNEILGIVCDTIVDGINRTPADSRRAHVLEAIRIANPTEGTTAIMRDKVKDTLRGYRHMDAKVRRSLEELGFAVTSDGKHYKITYAGDDRYTFALPKSCSDHRGGLNAASDISRLLF